MEKRNKWIILGSSIAILLIGAVGAGAAVALSSNHTVNINDEPNNNHDNISGNTSDKVEQALPPAIPNVPVVPHQDLEPSGQLQTEQPIILPSDFQKTDVTEYILSETKNIKDKAAIAYTENVIKDYMNTNLTSSIGATVNQVKLEPVGDFSPMRYAVCLYLNTSTNKLAGFDPVPSQTNLYKSSTYFPTQIMSDNVKQNQFKGFTQQALFYKKEINKHPRTLNPLVYETELNKQYERYGFKYPGWDCNYELKTDNQPMSNGYLNIPGQEKIDMMQKVREETPVILPDNKAKYPGGYGDGNFVKDQMKANTFRKHPAALNFYEQNVSDTTQAVDTEFTMSTAPGGTRALGLYAPAGETITFQLSEKEFEKFKKWNCSVEIVINENYWNIKYNRGDSGQVSNRYPRVQSSFVINSDSWSEMTAENKYQYSFGTPFGGNISIKFLSAMKDNENELAFGLPMTFRINNAVKSLSYFDGFTTEKDWNDQIKELLAGNITSPCITFLSTLYSANLPFSNAKTHKCGDLFAQNFKYPNEVCKKWDDFLLLSNNYKGNYIGQGRAPTLDMKFCDDIWGSAGAWGGSNIFYCPIKWGSNSFLNGGEPVNMRNWGTIHEINHNFEQNTAFFKAQSHPQTNSVNLFDLSVISDAGRFRNEINLNDDNYSPKLINDPSWGGWSKLSSMFNVVRYMNYVKATTEKDKVPMYTEWAYYAGLLYTIGSYNFTEFANYNAANFSNQRTDWTPMKFIYFMSQYFRTNMWNLSRLTPTWFTNQYPWPQEYPFVPKEHQLTQEDKDIVKRLEHDFPTIDFVANQYAAGQYLYDQTKKDYIYTTDITAAYQIPAIAPYNFNFEDFIVCSNPDFKWDKLYFSPETKLGGKLELDPTNNKHLIYTPNKDKINEIDEFDLEIKPTAESAQKLPSNYVPGYKWKIKVRQNVNRPVLTSYKPIATGKLSYDEIFNQIGMGSTKVSQPTVQQWSRNTVLDDIDSHFQMALSLGHTSIAKYELNYVVPETGPYYMWTKWFEQQGSNKFPLEAIRIKVDGNEVYNATKYSAQQYAKVNQVFNWEKNQVHKIEIGLVNDAPAGKDYQEGWMDLKLTNSPDYWIHDDAHPTVKNYDIFNHTVVPEVDLKTASIELINNYINSKEYLYKKREVDYTLYKSTSRKMTNDYATALPLDDYAFVGVNQTATTSKMGAAMLKDNKDYVISSPYFYSEDKFNLNYTPSSIHAKFTTPQTLDKLVITLPSQGKRNLFPQYWQVTIKQKDDKVTKLPVGGDGTMLNENITVPFNKTFENISEIQIDIFHTNDQGKNPGGVAINQILFYNGDTQIKNNLYNFEFVAIKKTSKDINFTNLKNKPTERFEVWQPGTPVPDDPSRVYNTVAFNTLFRQPSTINNICFSKGNYWQENTPYWFKIKLYRENGQVIDLGLVHNKTNANDFFIELDQTYTDIVKMETTMYSSVPVEKKQGLALGQLRFFSTRCDLDNAIGVNDPSIKLNGQLTYHRNDPEFNYSNINGVYLKSSAKDDLIQFTVSNTQAIKIIGRKGPEDGSFDVYINGNLVDSNVSCQSSTVDINVPVYTYTNNNNDKTMVVSIVNKSNKPIYLNTILMFGKNTIY